jgi:uncharacterized protein (DUF58 family)
MKAVPRAAGVAAAGLLLTLAAFTFNIAPLFVAGFAFLLIGLAAPAWVSASAHSARVTRRLLTDRVLEGEPVEAMIEVRRGRLGLPGGEVLDPLAGTPVSLSRPLSLTAGGAKAEVRVVARFARRGLRRLEPPSLVVSDMLGLASRTRAGTGPTDELLVLPRTEPVRWSARERGHRAEGADARPADEPLAAVDIDGLRPYRPGTPASRIHWAALARGAGLLERRLRADGETRPLIVLDARCSGAAEQLDAAVRAAASLTLELARRGGCRVLLPGERRAVAIEADLQGWSGVHARLAMVEGGPRARPPVLGAGAKLGPVLYVAAQPLERLPAALAGPGGSYCVIVLPAVVAPRQLGAPTFEVSGCAGYALRARGMGGSRGVSRVHAA